MPTNPMAASSESSSSSLPMPVNVPHSPNSQHSPNSPNSLDGANRTARLSEAEKKANHIASEKKRRHVIRNKFDKLSTVVPGLEGRARSEGTVLHTTVSYIRQLMLDRRSMIEALEKKGLQVPADYKLALEELPEGWLDAVPGQIAPDQELDTVPKQNAPYQELDDVLEQAAPYGEQVSPWKDPSANDIAMAFQ